MSEIKITEERDGVKGRYVAHIEGIAGEGELVFAWKGPGRLSLDHVGVPQELEGHSVGKALVEHAVQKARDGGYTILPRCSFAAAQFKRHRDWADVLDR
jgi:hypothetical protein